MNISEVLDLVIQVSESGRPGAAIQIAKAFKVAIDEGRRDDFFNNVNLDTIIAHAQHLAFEEEVKKKELQNKKPIEQGQEITDEPDSAA